MIDLSNFIYIDSVNYRLGIDVGDAKRIVSSITSGKLKREHIEASSPAKEVDSDPFYISRKLVTLSEFREFIKATSYRSDSEKEGWGWIWENSWKKREGVSWENPFRDDSDIVYNDNSDIFPVMQVSWNDAVAYTEWKTSVEELDIRIPMELEWEIFACKVGVKPMSEYIEIGNEIIKNSDDFIRILKEKLFYSKCNTGLLWEWTLDWYKGYSPDIKSKDFGDVYKVLRGGSLLSEDIQRTREFRFRRCPTARSPYYGFRLVVIP